MNDTIFNTVVAVFLLLALVNAKEIKKQTRSIWITVLFIFMFPFLIGGVAFSILIYVALIVYRDVITEILKKERGDNFLGLVNNLDVFNATLPLNRSNIIGLMVCEIDTEKTTKSVREYLKETLNQKLLKNKDSIGKLFSTPKTFSGMLYLEKINIECDQCIRTLPVVDGEMNVEALTEVISQWYYEPFKGSLLWDIAVGTQPLTWKDGTSANIKRYPIVLRVHHLLADGISILKVIIGTLGDKSGNVQCTPFEKYVESQKFDWSKLMEYVKQVFRAIAYFPASLFSILFVKSRDFHELHGKAIRYEEHLAFTLDSDGVYMEKVKEIKKTTGATVPEIILAAFSESIKEHFVKYNAKCPRCTTLAIPIVTNYTELQYMKPGEVDVKDVQFNNRYAIVSLQVPTFINNEENFDPAVPILSKLNVVKRLANNIKTSGEPFVSTLMFYYFFGVLPIAWVRFICKRVHNTIGISLIPGPPKITYGNGDVKVCDILFWLPHLLDLGLVMGSLSYDNRLIMTMNCDSVYISEKKGVQELLENIYKYIDMLEKEVQILRKKTT